MVHPFKSILANPGAQSINKKYHLCKISYSLYRLNNFPKLLSGDGMINDSTHLLLTRDQIIRTFVDSSEPNAKINPEVSYGI